MSAIQQEALRELRVLLEHKSAREVRAMCIQGLRRWRKRTDGRTNAVTMHGDLGLNTLEVLVMATDAKINVQLAKEMFLSGQQLDFRRQT